MEIAVRCLLFCSARYTPILAALPPPLASATAQDITATVSADIVLAPAAVLPSPKARP
jgi:hypothetical protein